MIPVTQSWHIHYTLCCVLRPMTTPVLCGQLALNYQDGGTGRKDCVIIILTSPLNSSSTSDSPDRMLVRSSNTAGTCYKLLARQQKEDFHTLKMSLSRCLAHTLSLVKWLFVDLSPLHELVAHFIEKHITKQKSNTCSQYQQLMSMHLLFNWYTSLHIESDEIP